MRTFLILGVLLFISRMLYAQTSFCDYAPKWIVGKDTSYEVELVYNRKPVRCIQHDVGNEKSIEHTNDIMIPGGILYTLKGFPVYLNYRGSVLYVMSNEGWLPLVKGKRISYDKIILPDSPGKPTEIYFIVDGREFKTSH